jgi:hypothetical protein
VGFGRNVKWPDYTRGFLGFGGGVGLFTVNRARVMDSVVTESPGGPGSCPERF